MHLYTRNTIEKNRANASF